MNIEYGVWSAHYGGLAREKTEAEARACHESRQLYDVTFFDAETPLAYLTINGDFVYLCRLDEDGRDFLAYQFDGMADGRIHLREVLTWEYDLIDHEKKNFGIRCVFTEDGQFATRSSNFYEDPTDFEPDTRLDVSSYKVRYPEFAAYDYLLDVNIDLTLLPVPQNDSIFWRLARKAVSREL